MNHPSHMYILECSNGKLYTGSTKNLKRRLNEHQLGQGANFTKKNLPVKLVYSEAFHFVKDAFKREKQIQKWSRAKKDALIEGNKYDLKRNSISKSSPAIP